MRIGQYTIPVVFHVIHENGFENIPDEKIFESIKIVNQDFRLWNADSIEIDQDFLHIHELLILWIDYSQYVLIGDHNGLVFYIVPFCLHVLSF